jgi:lycopene elongase/hydratase (dihydrobisanhydrobacterioruberin-forming)
MSRLPATDTASTTRAQRASAAEGFRTRSPLRRIGYRALPGDGFSYLLHMRPREWPIMAAHTALGFFLAAGWALGVTDLLHLAGGVAVWVVFLNGGTLAINSVYDKDEGDIGYLDAPPPPPRHLFAFSFGLMAIGQIIALVWFPPLFALVYGICFLMSILYSVPPFRWKAVAGLDLFINAWGFGTLTPLAGWAITGRPLEPWAVLALLAFCPLFASLYPLTQLYQYEEDRARGDRTLALVLGMRASLLFAIGAAVVAFALIAAGAASGPTGRWWPLLIVACAAWAWVLLPWYARREWMTSAEHKRGMYAALQAWAVTDIAVLLTFTLS